jgi:Uma2 family endonuclease
VELLEGWIVTKMPQNPPHSGSVGRINRYLARILPADWSLRVQFPITLSDSEPELDIVIARGKEGSYDKRHPRPADIGILMEVGDSSVLDDRRYKGILYAEAKIAQFWLINVVERKIEVHTKPRGGRYQKTVEFAEKDSVPLVLDGERIADIPVSELIAKT